MALPWVCISPNVPRMILRWRIMQTLDPEEAYPRRRIAAIDFSLEGFAVTAERLRGVASAVGEGRIGVEVAGTGPNFAAAYTLGANRRFTLASSEFEPDDNWRSQSVHEAVHAAFDLAGERPPSELDEAAAYLGETVWFRAGGLARTVRAPAAAAIHGAANAVVARLALHTTLRQRVRRDQVRELIAAINGHPGYAPSAAGR
ncbi:hypothetical protein [Caldovatus aquaticus]|uniref:IrrE N-terminal-like domain-containing protein n=1 Tax=Caldovatus aquaticus TaxID=2865671 RepID=A0ABS7F457_9PROT|nr:hypothetical protein [Caldovatus aquaticus]MBW8269737.1 hypothetical protein [Caldovatus aquaticus]